MYAEERQQAIAELVRSSGRCSVAELALEFAVTTETVRRDLSALAAARVVRRVHGGAVLSPTPTVVESGLDERDKIRAREKERIAQAAASLLPDAGGSIFIDAGSTAGRLAALLTRDTRLTVFTHAVPVAARAATLPDVELHLLPGRVRTTTQAAVGAETVRSIGRLRVDVAFLGANGVSADHGFSTPDVDEAAVKAALVRAARYVVVLADSTKLGRDATASFAGLPQVDRLITDAGGPDSAVRALRSAGATVVIA